MATHVEHSIYFLGKNNALDKFVFSNAIFIVTILFFVMVWLKSDK